MKLKKNNAEKLLTILHIEYTNIFDQKSRLESKSIGFLTIESLILSFALGILTVYLTKLDFQFDSKTKIMILIFVAIVYFGLLVILTSVLSLSPRLLQFIDDCDMAKKALDETKKDYAGSIVKSLLITNKNNKEVTQKISTYNDISFVFLTIDIGFVSIFIILFFIFMF
jgi:uncharacterized membrane protein YcjF (UPF0283 family)